MASQIGKAIDAAREKRSDQWIADRTAHLGHPISRTAISEYRRGKRKTMPVTDLLVIAGALGVPPVTLLFPGLPDAPSTLLPATDTPVALDALLWVTGERQTLPNGVDFLFSLEDGEMVGHVEGRREYRTSIDYAGSALDVHNEDDRSPVKQLLDACRELVAAFDEYNNLDSPLTYFESSLTPEQRSVHLRAHMELLSSLESRIMELDKKVAALGGVLIEERHITYDEPENDGEG